MSGTVTRQGVRFVTTGGIVAVVYLGLVTLLSEVGGLQSQVAVAVSYVTATLVHFLLNRRFVFSTYQGFHLRLGSQGRRYLLLVAWSYGVTAVTVATVPRVTDVPPIVLALAVPVVLAVGNFIALRLWIFAPATTVDGDRAALPDDGREEV